MRCVIERSVCVRYVCVWRVRGCQSGVAMRSVVWIDSCDGCWAVGIPGRRS